MPDIIIRDQRITYTIRESTRSRSLRLKIDHKGLEVIVPAGISVPNLEDILHSRSDWILKYYRQPEPPAPKTLLSAGMKIEYLGSKRTLQIDQKRHGNSTTVILTDSALQIRLRPGLMEEHRQHEVFAVLLEWYKQQAKRYISSRTAELARKHGFKYNRITIRGQKTRWGSCSSNRNLNFNWRLMQAPPEAVDYIIIHELCHLKEMNHSAAFWELVARYCPQYKKWRRWFKINGGSLQSFLA